jgi:hypothetical protein
MELATIRYGFIRHAQNAKARASLIAATRLGQTIFPTTQWL